MTEIVCIYFRLNFVAVNRFDFRTNLFGDFDFDFDFILNTVFQVYENLVRFNLNEINIKKVFFIQIYLNLTFNVGNTTVSVVRAVWFLNKIFTDFPNF